MEIQNPIHSKNKGKRQRIIGEKEQNIEQSKKPKESAKVVVNLIIVVEIAYQQKMYIKYNLLIY